MNDAYLYYVSSIRAVTGIFGITDIKVNPGSNPGIVLVDIFVKKGLFGFIRKAIVYRVVSKYLNRPDVRPLTDLIIIKVYDKK